MKYAIVIDEEENHPAYHHKIDNNMHVSQEMKKLIKQLFPDISKTYRIESNRVCKIISEFKHNYIHYVCVDLLNDNPGILDAQGLLFYNEDNKKLFFDKVFNK